MPLTPGYLVRDFARDLDLPLVIAAAPGLGTINHTLLTVEAARAVGLEVCCVVLTPWPARPASDRGLQPGDDREAGRHAEVAVLERIDLGAARGWPPMPGAGGRAAQALIASRAVTSAPAGLTGASAASSVTGRRLVRIAVTPTTAPSRVTAAQIPIAWLSA